MIAPNNFSRDNRHRVFVTGSAINFQPTSIDFLLPISRTVNDMNALFVLSWLVAIAIATAQSILPAACDKSAPLKRPSGRETSTSAQPGKLSGPFNVPTQTTGLSNSALQPGRLTSQKPTGNQTAIRSTTIANFSTTRTTRNPTNNVSTTPRFPTTLSSNGTSIPPSKFKFFESDILGVDPAAILVCG